MRYLRSIPMAAAMFVWTGAADAKDVHYRAGPISVPTSPCLIAKLNPGQGELCEPPVAETSVDPNARAASHLRIAQFFIGVHEFAQARRELDAGLAAKPDDFELLLLSSRLAVTFGEPETYDPERAEQDAGRAMKLRPQDSDARATYVASQRSKVAPSHLVREYGAVLAQDPKHDYSRRARADLLFELNRQGEALADLDVLVARDPGDPLYLSMRAESYMAVDNPKAAIEDYSAILRLQATDIMALTGRAAAFELLGNDEKALADYDGILGPVGGQPRYAIGGDTLGQYWFQRAFVLARLKRFKDAAVDMAAALGTEKSSVLRAQIFLRQNGFEELPLDGKDSPPLRSALQACFGLQSCFERIQRGI